MTIQPMLFAEPAQTEADERLEFIFAQATRYVTEDKPVALSLSMKVKEMHWLYDNMWERGHTAAGKLEAFVAMLRSRIKATSARAEKQRLGRICNRTEVFIQIFSDVAEGIFGDLQADLAEHLPKDTEDFWTEVGDRPGIEYTWSMTLQEVLDIILKVEAQPDEIPTHSP